MLEEHAVGLYGVLAESAREIDIAGEPAEGFGACMGQRGMAGNKAGIRRTDEPFGLVWVPVFR